MPEHFSGKKLSISHKDRRMQQKFVVREYLRCDSFDFILYLFPCFQSGRRLNSFLFHGISQHAQIFFDSSFVSIHCLYVFKVFFKAFF